VAMILLTPKAWTVAFHPPGSEGMNSWN